MPETPTARPISEERLAEIKAMKFTTGIYLACGYFETGTERELFRLAATSGRSPDAVTDIAFVDCETTHLDAGIGEAWEVAVILREQDGGQFTDTGYARQFAVDRTTADPEALRISCHDAHDYEEQGEPGLYCLGLAEGESPVAPSPTELSAGGPPEHNLEQPS
ncbi:hypothetical protein ABZ922_34595 [Streptomyces shenzhenensis]|uniref:hypothetical protein n=1 Tax=Streptomyces shenzhenensis TaxID=943815 RepID=UPI0033D3CCAB